MTASPNPASLSDQIRSFWDHRRENYGTQPLVSASSTRFQEHPIWLGVVDGLLPTAPAGTRLRVADLGCGTGMIAECVAKLGHDVIAIDFAPSRAAEATERLASYRNVEVRVGDALKPPLEQGEVDVILSRNLVWLLPDMHAGLQEWARIVGAGGRVAAIDSTHRTSRHRLPRTQRLLRMQKFPDGVAPGSPVNAAAGTPLSDVATAVDAATLWTMAGLHDVEAIDLGRVSAARMADWKPLRRILRRDTTSPSPGTRSAHGHLHLNGSGIVRYRGGPYGRVGPCAPRGVV